MISFIIPAHDEASLIGDSLDALHAAAVALSLSYEVIVVDDASTDDTAALAQLHGAQVVHVARRQIAAVRNAGAAVARGERLVFVDADTRISHEVLDAAMVALDRARIHRAGDARVPLDANCPRLLHFLHARGVRRGGRIR
jgi:glycosyltransferase involved in cell wall biosynthesis